MKMVQVTIGQRDEVGSAIRASGRGLSMIAASLLLPLAVACSGGEDVNGNDSVAAGSKQETKPLLVDNFTPDPSMYFGDSDAEQARARAALGETFAEGEVVQKNVNTSDCLGFTVPPFIGPPGDLQFFDNTLPPGGVFPTHICGFGTFGESRLIFIRNFSRITRPGSGQISVGVRDASVAECADLTVAMALGVDRGANRSPGIIFSTDEVPAQLQARDGGAVCASFVPMFGDFEPEKTDNKDLWVAVLARENGQNINNRVQVIRQSDTQ
jgi:hypothetical protein